MWAELWRRRGLRALVALVAAGAVLVMAGRRLDLATLRSLSLTWRWIAASIALNALSAVLKASVWDSSLRGMPTPLRVPFRDLCRSILIGLCLNTVMPGRVGEAARVASVRRRHPGAPIPVLVGSVLGEHILSSLGLVVTIGALLLGADRTVAGRFEPALLGLLAAVATLCVCVAVLALLLPRAAVVQRLPDQIAEVARGMRGGVEVFRPGRRRSSGLGIAAALASSTAQVASVYTALDAVGIEPSLARAGAAFIASSLVGVFPVIPGNVGAFQAVVATSLVTFDVDFGLGFGFAIALQAFEAIVGVGVGGWFLLREGLSLAAYRDARPHD